MPNNNAYHGRDPTPDNGSQQAANTYWRLPNIENTARRRSSRLIALLKRMQRLTTFPTINVPSPVLVSTFTATRQSPAPLRSASAVTSTHHCPAGNHHHEDVNLECAL